MSKEFLEPQFGPQKIGFANLAVTVFPEKLSARLIKLSVFEVEVIVRIEAEPTNMTLSYKLDEQKGVQDSEELQSLARRACIPHHRAKENPIPSTRAVQ